MKHLLETLNTGNKRVVFIPFPFQLCTSAYYTLYLHKSTEAYVTACFSRTHQTQRVYMKYSYANRTASMCIIQPQKKLQLTRWFGPSLRLLLLRLHGKTFGSSNFPRITSTVTP